MIEGLKYRAQDTDLLHCHDFPLRQDQPRGGNEEICFSHSVDLSPALVQSGQPVLRPNALYTSVFSFPQEGQGAKTPASAIFGESRVGAVF